MDIVGAGASDLTYNSRLGGKPPAMSMLRVGFALETMCVVAAVSMAGVQCNDRYSAMASAMSVLSVRCCARDSVRG